jgi:hypothetical protein
MKKILMKRGPRDRQRTASLTEKRILTIFANPFFDQSDRESPFKKTCLEEGGNMGQVLKFF